MPTTSPGSAATSDTLNGGAGDDTLDGGSGRDFLSGGEGDDMFVISSIWRKQSDLIMDFERGADKIVLDSAVFGALAGGVGAENFVRGKVALDADDFLLQHGNNVYYDADGNGDGIAIIVARIENGAQLDASDFLVLTDEGLLV